MNLEFRDDNLQANPIEMKDHKGLDNRQKKYQNLWFFEYLV